MHPIFHLSFIDEDTIVKKTIIIFPYYEKLNGLINICLLLFHYQELLKLTESLCIQCFMPHR